MWWEWGETTMIPFKEFCEFCTSNQRYSWFYITTDLWKHVKDENKSMVHLENTNDGNYVRCWYPAGKFYNRPIADEEYKKLMQQAIEKENWEMVKKLKERKANGNKE